MLAKVENFAKKFQISESHVFKNNQIGYILNI